MGAFVPRLRYHRTEPEEEHTGSGVGDLGKDEENLDLYEGYPNYYRKEDLNIELLREGAEPEMVTAMVYIMENDFGHRAPSRYYYKVLHDGYKAFRFPMHILEGALKECMDKDAAQRMIEEVQA